MTNEKRTDKPKKNFVKRGLASIAITGTVLTGAGAFLLFTGPGHSLVNSTVTTSEQVEQKVEAASTKVSSNVKQSLPSSFRDDDQEMEGTVKEVTDTSVTITRNGSDQSYSFASSAEIEQAQAGDWIKIELNQEGLVRELEREDADDQDARSDDRQDDATDDRDVRGSLVRVTDTQVVIEQNGKNVTFERAQNMEQDNDVQIGSQVELELNGSKQVTEIDEQS